MINTILDESHYSEIEIFDGEFVVKNSKINSYSLGFSKIGFSKEMKNIQPSVCILMERSAEYIALILAAWQAGFYVIPLNTAWPIEKNLGIIKRIKPTVVLVDDVFEKSVDISIDFISKSIFEEVAQKNVDIFKKNSLKPSDIAYIIFTSGSTGEPKGVVISAASFRSYIEWTKRRFTEYSNSTKLLLTSELTFDITMGDIAFALAFGTDIGVAKYNNNIPSILAMIMEHNIDVLYSVPTTHLALTAFAKRKRGTDLSSIKLILSGGDRFPWQLVKDYMQLTNGAHFYNVYGPTEVTINCFSIRLDNKLQLSHMDMPVPIGHCFDSLDYVLLDNIGNSAGQGELCVAGPQIMMGYYGDAELTQKALVNDPRVIFINRPFYRTGDLAYEEDGLIYLQGRIDGLVKIRGYRIHPDEVSKVLDTCQGVAASATVAYGSQSEAALAVFIKLQKGSVLGEEELSVYLAKKIPGYMIPDQFIFLDELPLNQSGKIDKKLLSMSLV